MAKGIVHIIDYGKREGMTGKAMCGRHIQTKLGQTEEYEPDSHIQEGYEPFWYEPYETLRQEHKRLESERRIKEKEWHVECLDAVYFEVLGIRGNPDFRSCKGGGREEYYLPSLEDMRRFRGFLADYEQKVHKLDIDTVFEEVDGGEFITGYHREAGNVMGHPSNNASSIKEDVRIIITRLYGEEE